MANIFEAVREAVPVPLAAERYGLKANRAGMVRCPFHDDHNPSLKLNEDYFYCFGCGAGGDVVSLTAKLFNLRPYEAASKLAVDFGVDVPATAPPDGSLNRFRSDLLRCQQVLDEYLNLLIRWHRKYAPRALDYEPDDRYQSIVSNRFDSSAFKKLMPDVYKSFIRQSTSKRFSIA